jgi:hypothetical protein
LPSLEFALLIHYILLLRNYLSLDLAEESMKFKSVFCLRSFLKSLYHCWLNADQVLLLLHQSRTHCSGATLQLLSKVRHFIHWVRLLNWLFNFGFIHLQLHLAAHSCQWSWLHDFHCDLYSNEIKNYPLLYLDLFNPHCLILYLTNQSWISFLVH